MVRACVVSGTSCAGILHIESPLVEGSRYEGNQCVTGSPARLVASVARQAVVRATFTNCVLMRLHSGRYDRTASSFVQTAPLIENSVGGMIRKSLDLVTVRPHGTRLAVDATRRREQQTRS